MELEEVEVEVEVEAEVFNHRTNGEKLGSRVFVVGRRRKVVVRNIIGIFW